jgi:large subunit ribosomal protein L6
MSRIGKKPIPLPKGVTVEVKDRMVKVKGPKGELSRSHAEGVKVVIDGAKATVERVDQGRRGAELHGLTRTLVSNMVQGVTTGFKRELEINGVGYRAEVQGPLLNISLGYSHPINFPVPKGIKAAVDKQKIILEGIDRELLGMTAANIRALRSPDPYKAKGIKYVEEVIKRKVGKTGAS